MAKITLKNECLCFQYDAAPPTQNQFSPPEPDDIRTIYVPYDNAANVPDVFDVSVGSSFGYNEPAPEPVKPVTPPSSYDNPISSFDAPIYDENSYTAAAVSLKRVLKLPSILQK